MSHKRLELLDQLPPSLGSQLSASSLSVVFASDAPGLPITLTNDTNYGLVGANTLRTAAQIGNAAGAADFNAGAAGAQTLRVVLANNSSVRVQDGSGNSTVMDFGASTAGLRVAALLGNATGAIAYNAGASNAQTIRVMSANEFVSQLNSASGVTIDGDFGASSSALRTAAQIGNATGAAAFGAGATSAQTLRVVLPTDQSAIPVTQSGSWANKITDGTNNVTVKALNVQVTGTDYGLVVNSVIHGLTTGGGGGYVDVKVNPSGALVTDASGSSVSVSNFPATQAVTQSGTWDINNISGTISLPTGAATETTLAALNAKFNSLGQKTMANSAPVVIASDQSAVPVTPPALTAIASQNFGSIAFGSLTNSFATVLTAASDVKIIAIFSSLDTPVTISFDGGTTSHVNLDGESLVLDLAASGMKISSGAVIQAKYSGSAPTSGSIRISVMG